MELERFSYDNKIVKAFIIATVIFGLVGMLVGLTAAIQLVYPIFNFETAVHNFWTGSVHFTPTRSSLPLWAMPCLPAFIIPCSGC